MFLAHGRMLARWAFVFLVALFLLTPRGIARSPEPSAHSVIPIATTTLAPPPGVAKTLVLTNNSLIPGNFLAANGGRPMSGCVDPTRHIVYALSWGVLTAINGTTNTVVGGTLVGTNDSAIACDPVRNEVFVADADANRVYVVDTTTLGVVANVSVGAKPQAVAVDAGRGEVYVGHGLSNDVRVVAESSRTVVATIPVAAPVSGLAYDSGKGEVFASLGSTDNVSVLSDATHSVVAQVHVGSFPRGLAYDATDGYVYVANMHSGNVSVINDTTNTVVASVAVGQQPVAAAYDPAAGQVFVADSFSATLSVISAATHAYQYLISLDGGPNDVQVDAGSGHAFVDLPGWGNVSVVDVGTQRVIADVSVGAYPSAVGVDPVHGKVFVLGGPLGTVSIVSDATNRVLTSIPVGHYPRHLAVDPGRGLVFVPAMAQAPYRMYVISSVSDSLIGSFPLGYDASAVAVDPDRGLVFVVDSTGPPNYLNQIEVFNEAGFARVAVLTVATYPEALAYDAGTGQMFVGASETYPAVYMINDANLSVVGHVTVSTALAAINTPIGSLAYNPELGEIFVPVFGENAIHVVSDVNESLLGTVPGVPSPWGLAYVDSGLIVATPNSTFPAPATPSAPGSVRVISDATDVVLATVTVGSSPAGAAYDANVAAIYVANEGQGTLSILPMPRPYMVTFTESGLPAGTSWSVGLDGRAAWTRHPEIEFLEPNGSYAYSVGTWIAYLPDPATGTQNVSGAAVSVRIAFSALPSSGPPPGVGIPVWAVVAGLAAIGAAGTVAGFVLHRRRKARKRPPPAAPPPPQVP